jgi:hypothetical protein
MNLVNPWFFNGKMGGNRPTDIWGYPDNSMNLSNRLVAQCLTHKKVQYFVVIFGLIAWKTEEMGRREVPWALSKHPKFWNTFPWVLGKGWQSSDFQSATWKTSQELGSSRQTSASYPGVIYLTSISLTVSTLSKSSVVGNHSFIGKSWPQSLYLGFWHT